MAKPLSELIKKLPSKVDAEASVRAAEMLAEMNLADIRKTRNVTQNQIAEALEVKQPSVAQLEKREDTYISTLRNYLSSLGVKLELIAQFPDGRRVAITGFNNIKFAKQNKKK